MEEGEIHTEPFEVRHDPEICFDMFHQALAANAPSAIAHTMIAIQLDFAVFERDVAVEIAELGEMGHRMLRHIQLVIKKRNRPRREIDGAAYPELVVAQFKT